MHMIVFILGLDIFWGDVVYGRLVSEGCENIIFGSDIESVSPEFNEAS